VESVKRGYELHAADPGATSLTPISSAPVGGCRGTAAREARLYIAFLVSEHPTAALSAEEALDELLATIDRGLVPASELRILLRLSARDETGEQLAESLTQAPSEITRASTRLDKRGLIKRKFESDAPSGFVFSITEAGLDTLDPLLTLCADPHNRRAPS
jgi:DNA-binding MarR family transcriptional regulator